MVLLAMQCFHVKGTSKIQATHGIYYIVYKGGIKKKENQINEEENLYIPLSFSQTHVAPIKAIYPNITKTKSVKQ